MRVHSIEKNCDGTYKIELCINREDARLIIQRAEIDVNSRGNLVLNVLRNTDTGEIMTFRERLKPEDTVDSAPTVIGAEGV